jgi:protein NrfC
MTERKIKGTRSEPGSVSRREFLKRSGTVAAGVGVGLVLGNMIWLKDGIAALPASAGYLLVDTKKCQGCLSCMLACSLVHEGVENLSLSRIQVVQNSFARWPADLNIGQCRQCETPSCVEACPTGALHVETRFGNVRMIDEKKCVGCGSCIRACPYEPTRTTLNPAGKKALKCDLCAGAAYHWDKAEGGPQGKQACVSVCPIGAIRFTEKLPVQKGDAGYNVNLRGAHWTRLGYPEE